MAGPQELIAQMMAAQAAGGAPGSQGMPMGPPMPAGSPGMRPAMAPPDMPEDEAMLDDVSNQMGGEAPPPTGGMRWVNLAEDQQALMADPSPENVSAFEQYWGEDKLPPGMQDSETDEIPEAGE